MTHKFTLQPGLNEIVRIPTSIPKALSLSPSLSLFLSTMRLHTAITALAASSTFFSAGVANASTPRIEDDGMTTTTISTDARDGEYMYVASDGASAALLE